MRAILFVVSLAMLGCSVREVVDSWEDPGAVCAGECDRQCGPAPKNGKDPNAECKKTCYALCP